MFKNLLFLGFLLCSYCCFEKEWFVKENEYLQIFYPKTFQEVDSRKFPDGKWSFGAVEMFAFADSAQSKTISIRYELRKIWEYDYEADKEYLNSFYNRISDSIKVITSDTIIVNKIKFNRLELIHSPRKEEKMYYVLRVFGPTKKGLYTTFKYTAPNNEYLQEYIQEAHDILKRLKFKPKL